MVKGHGRHLVLLAILIVAGAGTFAYTQESGDRPSANTVTIKIPKGASDLVAQGKTVPGIPDRIEGKVGDTLLVDNRDDSTQFVAGFAVSPHQVLKIPLNREGEYETTCSVHRDQSIKMVVTS
ncbi:MAG: hypothetical protein WBW44_07055 [Solirubrobacterales bacterium]